MAGVGVVSPDMFFGFWMRILMTYLTNVWNLSFTHAAGIINLFEGSVAALTLVIALISDSFLGLAPIVGLLSLLNALGFGLLSMSAPRVLGHSIGPCKQYTLECVGDEQRSLFYAALPIMAVGLAITVFYMEFFFGKIAEHVAIEENMDRRAIKKYVRIVLVIGGFGSNLLVTFLKSWAARFGYMAIVSILEMVIFLCCCQWWLLCMCGVQLNGSPLANIPRVLVASAYKRRYSADVNYGAQLYENTPPHQALTSTPKLRFLNKASIILPHSSLEQQKNNKWTLCTVTEVEETKMFIQMIPIWPTLILCGVVTSIGSTYFQEQANNLNRRVGKYKLPSPILLVIHDVAKMIIWSVGKKSAIRSPRRGIFASIICSVLCCIIAAIVENRRLHVIARHELADKQIPMSVLWMVPQYVSLAGIDAFLEVSVANYFDRQLPPSTEQYLVYFTHFVSGFGIMSSVLSVFLFGKFSKRKDGMNWFQDTLNKSRLDNYYWALTVLSSVNLGYYLLVAKLQPYRTMAEQAQRYDSGAPPSGPSYVTDGVTQL